MTPRLLALVPLAAVALAAAPAAEAAKKPRKRLSATYMVTLDATLDSKWQYHDHTTIECDPGQICTSKIDGSGSTHVHVKTKRPFPMLVGRGYAGRPPSLNLGSDGIPVAGTVLVQGSLVTDYEGAWQAANPDIVASTIGCGHRPLDDFASIGWAPERPGHLKLLVAADTLREDCPSGPPRALEWTGDEAPLLGDVLAPVGKGKFLGTKQFTVRGSKTFNALVPTTSLPHKQVNGDAEATWRWEATFRMKTGKRR